MASPESGLESLLRRAQDWPLLRKIADLGMGPEAISEHTRKWQARILDADKKVVSVCPYCAVGCSQLIYVKNGAIIDIEGNPASPINQGMLCPKGASTFELLSNPNLSRPYWARNNATRNCRSQEDREWKMIGARCTKPKASSPLFRRIASVCRSPMASLCYSYWAKRWDCRPSI